MHQKSTVRRLLALPLMCLIALFVAPAVTAHAQDAPDCSVAIDEYEGTAIITVDPVDVTPGGSVTLTGTGFPPGVAVPLFFNDAPIGAPVTDAEGNFSFVYTIPLDTPTGVFEFSAACGTFILTSNITISPIPVVTTTPPPTQPLPVTGSDSLPLLQMAAALIVVGGLIVFLTRRQHERRAEADPVSV